MELEDLVKEAEQHARRLLKKSQKDDLPYEALTRKQGRGYSSLPFQKRAGVYLIKQNERVIYVGESCDLGERLASHFLGENGRKRRECSFCWIEVKDENMRRLVESLVIAYLIKQGEPLTNYQDPSEPQLF